MTSPANKIPKDKLDELIEAKYQVKHQEMERLMSRSQIMSPRTLSQDSELREHLLLNRKKRIVQRKLEESSPWSLFRLKYFLHKNTEMIALMFIELNSQFILHPISTVKTRIQAKNMLEDVAHFERNKVESKSFYSGLLYSYLISGLSCSVFANMQKIITALSANYTWMTNEHILYASFTATDLFTSPLRCWFEVRRSYFQMGNPSFGLYDSLRKAKTAYFSLLLRDFFFRTAVFMTLAKEQPHERNGTRFAKFTFSMFISSLLAAPLDVVFTKIATQKSPKYTGMTQAFRTILKEEGFGKLISGFSMKFAMFMIIGSINALCYHRMLGFTQEAFSVDWLM
jgi:hypothetical protein